MLLGMSKPIHVLVSSVTARGIVNLSALAVLEAQVAPPPPSPLPRGEGE
jgi:malate dehydrogenase (oxaloacetate-decarboxylating)(NADP+)